MSRAIGDGYLKPYVSSVPEVTVTDRSDADECLILASDGLWDVVSNEAACEVARACLRRGRARWCAEAAALLTKLALARRSSDNVSVVVVDLRRRDH
jgi:protein phosphatase 2C